MLNTDPWWDDPFYKKGQGSLSDKGAYILNRLLDSEKLGIALGDLYRNGTPAPSHITKFERQVILAYMGASEEEIADVQKRMGRVWR